MVWFLSKRGIVEHEAKEEGEKIAGERGVMLDWARAHKAQIGYGLGMVTAALMACPDPHCQTAASWLGPITTFLIGAGILPSDYHVKAQQDSQPK